MLISLLCVLIGFAIECFCQTKHMRLASIGFNLAYAMVAAILHSLLQPVTVAITGLVMASAGFGLIALPDHGWRLIPALAVYVLAMDLGEYLFHRAQHRYPILWAMHSLHHSDPDMNISTTGRHFWAEQVLKSLTIYLLVGLVFKTNATITGAYGLICLYNYFVHMRVKVGYGRFSLLLNAPLYHRLHHSRRSADENVNFAALLPVFDVIFGSYRAPLALDFPPTGLASRDAPTSLVDAVCWPARTLGAARPRPQPL